MLVHYYKECFKYSCVAHLAGQITKQPEWLNDMHMRIKLCSSAFRSGHIQLLDLETRLRIYSDAIKSIDITDIKAELYLEIATCHFHSAVIAIENKNFKKALYQMKDCYMPLQEAISKGCDSKDFISECRVLKEDVTVHQCMADSMEALHTGKIYTFT